MGGLSWFWRRMRSTLGVQSRSRTSQSTWRMSAQPLLSAAWFSLSGLLASSNQRSARYFAFGTAPRPRHYAHLVKTAAAEACSRHLPAQRSWPLLHARDCGYSAWVCFDPAHESGVHSTRLINLSHLASRYCRDRIVPSNRRLKCRSGPQAQTVRGRRHQQIPRLQAPPKLACLQLRSDERRCALKEKSCSRTFQARSAPISSGASLPWAMPSGWSW
jgi:hypothetical protein